MRLTKKRRAIAAAAAALAIGAAVGGFVIDFEGFAGNALAELAGVILSVLLAVLVLDRLVESDRQRRWNLVAEETISTLRFALVRAGVAMYLRLDAPRPPEADPFTMELAGDDAFTQSFRALGGHLRSLSDAQLEPGDWIAEVEEQIRLIREGVTPRLIAVGDEDTVAAVAHVEGRFQNVLYAVWLAERFGGEQVATAAADLCEAMARAAATVS